jgi:hypothetical protein
MPARWKAGEDKGIIPIRRTESDGEQWSEGFHGERAHGLATVREQLLSTKGYRETTVLRAWVTVLGRPAQGRVEDVWETSPSPCLPGAL